MHIPDGYLSPATCAVGYAVAVPTLAVASRRVSDVVTTRQVPRLALFAALAFVVMMFNIPIPDGTTAHAVGAVVIAISLGPWAAIIAVSVALLFQALLFGDGGVLAYGVNVTNMAILMPLVGYAVYRVVSAGAPVDGRRRVVAAFLGGYAGINASALATGIELGLQPDLFHTASGAPLYSPYDLSQAVPAMLLPHLTVAGVAEGILTAGVLAYLQRADLASLGRSHRGIPLHAGDAEAARPAPSRLTPGRVAVGFMALMVLLTPLGLLAPGGAFGEDAPANLDLAALGLSAVPAGLARYAGFWNHTVLGGYGFAGGRHADLAYILSAVVGILVVGGLIFAVGVAVTRLGGRRHSDADESDHVGV